MSSEQTVQPPTAGPRRWLLLAIGPLVLGAILYTLDPQALWAAVRRARPELLFAAVLIVLPTVFVRTLRWRLLLGEAADECPRYLDLVAVYAYAIFVGVLTPGRVGEFVKTVHLTRRGMGLGTATASVLLDRLFDIALLIIVAVIALLLLAVPGIDSTPTALGLITALALLGWVCWRGICSERVGKWLDRRAASAQRGTRVFGALVAMRSEFIKGIRQMHWKTLSICVMLTVIAWSINYLANYLLARSLGLGIGYLDIAGISAIVALLAQLPITVLGAGTRDAGLIVLLAPYGASVEQAVILSTFFLGLTLLTGMICGLSMLTRAAKFELDTPRTEHRSDRKENP